MHTTFVLKTTNEQLGNQLLPYMSVYAYCLERSRRLVYLPFDRYLNEFERMSCVPRGVVRRRVLYRALRTAQSLGMGVTWRYPRHGDTEIDGAMCTRFVRLPPSPNANEPRDARVEFFLGWRYYNPLGIARHRDAVRREFAPARRYIEGIASFIDALPHDRPVVGVHVRGGDFREHQGGALSVSIDEYRAAMDALVRAGGVDPMFCVFSDESVDARSFSGFDVRVSRGSMIEDLFRMAHCPLIIGTASTFNLCAALYGGGAVWQLRSRQKRLMDPESHDREVVLTVEEAVAALGHRVGALRIGL